jgi:hypothetical protein
MSTLWQPLTWIIFHSIALNYNENYHNEYISFFEAFKVIIPCSICRNHYIEHISKEDMSIEKNVNADNIFNWTIRLHNLVNKMNHKREWNYEEAKKYYMQNNFNNKILKNFIYEYIRTNFKKKPLKTIHLIKMLNSLAYLHPNPDKRNKLIAFKEKFELNRFTLKNWLMAFVLIIQQ